MSIAAMVWALDAARTGPVSPDARLLLATMADYADERGRGVYPMQARLAERLGLSDRSVRRGLATLQEAGLIEPGDPQLVAHYTADRRPRVWNLVMDPLRREDATVRPDAAVRADTLVRDGGTDVSDVTQYLTQSPPCPPQAGGASAICTHGKTACRACGTTPRQTEREAARSAAAAARERRERDRAAQRAREARELTPPPDNFRATALGPKRKVRP